MKLTLPAPAKINTFLHIVGRRDDGYHLLESVMVLVSLADTVELTLREDANVRLLEPPAGITEESDLACRAARALQKETGTTLGVDVRLSKRIPQGAGMGGGSSDAATTLLGLNRLWKLNLSGGRLMEIGLRLGADVPFFIFGQAAFVRGIGELLTPVTFPPTALVIAHPRVGIATARAFANPMLERNTPATSNANFNLGYGKNNIQIVSEMIEPLAIALKGDMKKSCGSSRMTGSGSAYFAVMPEKTKIPDAVKHLQSSGFDAWAAHSIERHPLQAFAKPTII